ncbi:MAG: class I SAM-dependent methyltransferase [Betaproteobacteria bacterium]
MSLPHEYFDRLYRSEHDPWRFRARWYERRKRDLTMAALPKAHYPAAFELGCSIGELTVALAERCGYLLACDISPRACAIAKERTASFANVIVEARTLPAQWPVRAFDLIVVSEVAYYFDDEDLAQLVERASASLAPGGSLVACHWRHPVADYPQSAATVHAAFDAAPHLHCLVLHLESDFILQVWSDDARSVAQIEGLA